MNIDLVLLKVQELLASTGVEILDPPARLSEDLNISETQQDDIIKGISDFYSITLESADFENGQRISDIVHKIASRTNE